jgi:hypothetical protein
MRRYLRTTLNAAAYHGGHNLGRRVAETLDATVSVGFWAVDGQPAQALFQGTGHHAGLEVAGDLQRLRALWAAEG